MKIDCIIVDDEPLAREGIAGYVQKVSYLNNAGAFKSATDAKVFIEQHPVDLIFLDINMPGMSGLDFVKSLDQPPKIVFTTAYREFALDSYELDATDYLLKPISFERFYKAVDKVYEQLEIKEDSSAEDYIFVKVDGVIQKVVFEELIFVEAMKDYVKMHLENDKVLITLLSLKQMDSILPDYFFRTHRSYVVNLKKVDKIDGNMLCTKKHQLPVAPQLRETVIEAITNGKYYKR